MIAVFLDKALKELREKYGEGILLDGRKIKAHLLDMQVERKYILLLSDISNTDSYKEFFRNIKTDDTAAEKLIFEIERDFAYDRNAVEITVNSLVFALTGRKKNGFAKDEITDDEAKAFAEAIRSMIKK